MSGLEKAQEELQKYLNILDNPEIEITLKDLRDCLAHLTFAVSEIIGMIDSISKRQEEIGKHHLKGKDKKEDVKYIT